MSKESSPSSPPATDTVVEATRTWVRLAVVGLDLCPFAKGPVAKDRVRYVVADARTEVALLATLEVELAHLRAVDERECETTLLMHPYVLHDFLDYNDFVGVAEALVTALDLDGFVQIATFHPDYRFADAGPDDVGNATNRSPYPMLQLLRETSVDRAVAAIPDASTVYAANLATMDRLGADGWAALQRRWTQPDRTTR